MATSPSLQSTSGGCHCGTVRFEAEVDITTAAECNCSYCSKIGLLLAFTGEKRLCLTAGHHALTDYRFHTGHVAHLFCARCGTAIYGRVPGPDNRPLIAVNLRCVDGLDLTSIDRRPVNGAAR